MRPNLSTAASPRSGSSRGSHHRILVLGTGFSGLGAAIRLKQAGIEDFVILERGTDVGGTWYWNTYPGCACDVPSHLYSFSFAPNPDWTHTYSGQAEIQRYLRGCAERFGLTPHIRLNTELLEAAWDEDAQRWRFDTTEGELTADVFVAGPGPLVEPKLPDVPGIDSFEGTTFHSARWNHGHDLTGERVAVVGTGASSIQFVPRIQPKVGRMHVFQRTAPWIARHSNRRISHVERQLYRRSAVAQRAVRGMVYALREALVPGFRGNTVVQGVMQAAARRHLHAQVKDPVLREKLTPHYAMGCKRILISNDYYPALAKPNVDVVTDGIAEIRPRSVVTTAGEEIEVDTIIFGTGFHVTDMPVAQRLVGRGGRRLSEVWDGSPQAYLGTTIAGFPNLFLLTGPSTGLGHNSIVYMIESQLDYMIGALEEMQRSGAAVVEVTQDAQDGYIAEIQRQMPGTVWVSGGCKSWYIDKHGLNTTLWPSYTFAFRRKLRRFDPAPYSTERRAAPAPVVAAA